MPKAVSISSAISFHQPFRYSFHRRLPRRGRSQPVILWRGLRRLRANWCCEATRSAKSLICSTVRRLSLGRVIHSRTILRRIGRSLSVAFIAHYLGIDSVTATLIQIQRAFYASSCSVAMSRTAMPRLRSSPSGTASSPAPANSQPSSASVLAKDFASLRNVGTHLIAGVIVSDHQAVHP